MIIENSDIKKSSITDSPRNVSRGEKDEFGIEPFENGLIEFIKRSNSPITIALQGEWGSGKTSLMNSLQKNLSQIEGSQFHSIWLNTWEYALMKDPESTLLDIISGLIKETSAIARVDQSKTKEMLTKLWSGIKDTTTVVAKHALDKTVQGAGTIVDAFVNNGTSSISAVRNELEEVIQKCIKDDKKEGFVFFIDDLDRIDPPVAVQLLELLKNIYTLENCIFILAIDYDVVIKGLEPKFGKFSEQNEREFRSFFDKIIQVPFSMPVSNYGIDKFLKASLLSIGYITEEQAKKDKLIEKFTEISDLSVGKNPRALKRLMNSLSLISCINDARDNTQETDQLNEDLELLVNFALVSIQIAYPLVYKLLTLHPGYDKWDENIALQMNFKPLDQQSIDKLNKSEEFDDDWEKILFRLCENDYYLKKRALNISRLLNSLKSAINEKEEEVEDIVGSVISLSSVTNVQAFDKPVVDYHRGNLLKEIRHKLLPILREKLPELKNEIHQIGSRIQSNFRFHVSKSAVFVFSSNPKEGKIILRMHTWVGFGQKQKGFKADLEDANLFSDLDTIVNEYKEGHKEFSQIGYSDLYDIGIWKNDYFINLRSSYNQNLPADFYTDASAELISNHIIRLYKYRCKIQEIASKRIEYLSKNQN